MAEIFVLEPNRSADLHYPLRLAASFVTVTPPVCAGDGKTLSISSSEVRFTASQAFAAGQRIQVSLDWPARLDNKIPLRLVVSGEILRSGRNVAVMTIKSHEFRTRGTRPSLEPISSSVAIGA